ncbi:Phospholipase A2-like domain [Popillia japonica]|uniref:Phospholipase A2-like domain n=1 Tax=Popillia japonica TaxID=7064 RepID=A0AAW1MZE7_POPJA
MLLVREGSGLVNSLINKLPIELHLLVNSLINKLPIELHLSGYQYCGPSTKLEKRLQRGDRGINPLDQACKEHDIAYSQSSDLKYRHDADRILQERAWNRIKSNDQI